MRPGGTTIKEQLMENEDKSLFINDFFKKGMLHCKVIRASIPTGKVLSIKKPKLPANISIFSADDIPGLNELKINNRSMPILVSDKVRYEGEPILIICGPDKEELDFISREIVITYETDYSLLSLTNAVEHQIVLNKEMQNGNPDSVFGKAFQIIEGIYETESQSNYNNDPIGAVILYKAGKLEILCSSQWPDHVRTTVAAVVGIRQKDISVKVPEMSSSCDRKIWYPSLITAYAAIAALKRKQNVRIILSKEEEQLYTPKGARTKIDFKTAVNKEGLILGQDIKISVDIGAYPLLVDELLARLTIQVFGLYKNSNTRISGKAIKTSSPPMDAFNGLGSAQAFFAIETHTSKIASLAQSDPYLWKTSNLQKGNHLAEKLLSTIIKQSDFRRKSASYEMLRKRRTGIGEDQQKLKGIGLSAAYQGNGIISGFLNDKPGSISVRLDKEGLLHIHTSIFAPELKVLKIWIKTAEEILGIEENKIIIAPDITSSPDTGPSILSRHITEVTDLIARSCQTIKKKRFRDPLPIEVKRSLKKSRKEITDNQIFTTQLFQSKSSGASVVEIELDPVTLETDIKGIWMILDCGRIFEMDLARNSAETGILQSLLWCRGIFPLDERYPGLINLSTKRTTQISISFQDNNKDKPGSIKELPGSLIPSAYISALSQAAGIYFNNVPITPYKIYKYLEHK